MRDERILPPAWVIRHDLPADGVTNMAHDLALLEGATPGVATWRWYTWDRPTVSFGRNERTTGIYTPESIAQSGLAVVRRPTGGRALLHARELTYSVTLTLPSTVGWRQAYDAINAVLVGLLRTVGIPAALSAGHTISPDGALCFDLPASGEITVHGRKLVGSAVWRERQRYLQHGSLLIHDDQPRLIAARHDTGSSDGDVAHPPPAAALAALLPGLDDRAIMTCLTGALDTMLTSSGVAANIARTAYGVDTDPQIRALADQHASRLRESSWIWRR